MNCLMAHSTRFLVLLVTAVGFNSAAYADPLQLSYSQHKWLQYEPGCQPKEPGHCSRFVAEFPLLGNSMPAGVRDSINQDILSGMLELSRSFSEAQPLKSPLVDLKQPAAYYLQQAAERFFADNRVFRQELPEAVGIWELTSSVEVEHINSQVLCLRHSYYAFTGGAHGIYQTRFYNYDLKTGKLLKLEDLFQPGFQKRLTALAEAAFRKQRELTPTVSLAEAGFEFTDNRFALNELFLMTPQGLRFLFNVYEVAPYVTGDTEFAVDYNELEPLLKPESQSWFRTF